LLVPIAVFCAATGQLERAERIASRIDIRRDRAQALAEIACAIADSQPERALGLFAQAEETASAIDDQEIQVAAQVAVASARLSASPAGTDGEQRLRHLLAQALVTASWPDVLPTLGKVAPDAVVALHDWTLAQRKSSPAATVRSISEAPS
jgi:hypothetical protein